MSIHRISEPAHRALNLLFRVVAFAACLGATLGATSMAQANVFEEKSQAIVTDFNAHSATVFAQSIDIDGIYVAISPSLDLTDTQRVDFERGFRESMRQLAPQLSSRFNEAFTAKLLRVKPSPEGARALIRLNFGDEGLMYWEIYLGVDANGSIVVKDWLDFSSGQTVIEKFKQTFALLLRDFNFMSRLVDAVQGNEGMHEKLARALEKMNEGDYVGFSEIYNDLDESLRSERMLCLAGVSAASFSANESHYTEALGNLARYHGNDPTLALLLIDHYVIQEQYDLAIQALRRLQTYIGLEDPALTAMEANVYLIAQNYAKAITTASTAITREPELEDGYWTLVAAGVQSEQFDNAVNALEALEQTFGYDFNGADFDTPYYAGLTGSTAYRDWMTH